MSIQSTKIRRAAAASAGIAGAIGVSALFVRHLMRRPLPRTTEQFTVEGLSAPVEVIRDRWGVPHIYARTEEDLFFAQGFVHAQDRLFQMDANRRVGSGRISEIVGPAGIESDRFARTFAWHHAAAAQVQGLMADEETHRLAQAYAAGVNAYIREGKLPAEFLMLAYAPEPWTPFDSCAWGTVLAWGLSVNWETELMRARLVAELGPQKAFDLTPDYGSAYPCIVPEAEVGSRLAQALADAYHRAMDELPLGQLPAGPGAGSNNWVVSGNWTTSGRPILANDPHLPPIFPTLWYENHLVGGRFNVTGFTTPGVPGVIIGHNERVAWGITNAQPDVQDIYVERFHPQDSSRYEADGEWVEAEEELVEIRVRGRREPLQERVRHTRHGPVISGLIEGEHRDLSLRWAAYEPNNHLRALLQICLASDWKSFRIALKEWAFPSQNVVYADVEGNVGYVMPGRVPLRARGDGLLPVPGWSGEYEWQGWIPWDELPSAFNPPSGYVVTANNRVVGDGYPHLLSGEWQPPYRARRISDLIEALAPLDVAANGRIQNDTVSLLALRFVQLALAHSDAGAQAENHLAQQALLQLEAWDGDMHPERAAPAIAYGWLVHFTRAVLTQAVGPELCAELLGQERLENFPGNPFHEIGFELVVRWLQEGAPSWVGDIHPLLPPALAGALGTLRAELGPRLEQWRWGDLHYVELHNHLARIPGLGRLWRPRTLPLGGDGYSVSQAEVGPRFPPRPVHIIPSCRMIVDVGAWDNSRSTLPGGQSGHPASDHYQDSVEDWLQGGYHPMLYSREKIEQARKSQLTLLPAH
ncbi:MAG: penicillin acylase family protein [bacterium]